MKEIRLVLLGFGSANRALAKILLEKSEQDDYSSPSSSCRRCLRVSTSGTTTLVSWKVVCIITRRHGRACVPCAATSEINLQEALGRMNSGVELDNTLVVTNTRATFNDTNTTPTINTTAIDAESTEETIKLLKDLGETQTANILVEAIPSNPKSNGEPAISFIRTALQAGMHVASANKCPLSHKNSDRNDGETYFELQKIAKNSRKLYLHESAVMDGVPVFSLWNTLPCVRCTKIRGLFNSTTTLILSRMEGNIDKVVEGDGQIEHHGETFDEAFQAAKQMGIVEEDESLDIDGYDAAMKLRALCVFLGSLSEEYDLIIPPLEAIPRDTIRRIDTDRIYDEFGMSRKKMRSVASAELFDVSSDPANGLHRPVKTWKMCVKNEFLSPSDTLYNMKGTSSSVQFYTDTMGPITIVSTDPTLKDTAYGLFSDIVRIASQSLY